MNDIEPIIRAYIAENILFSDKGYPYPDDASFLNEGIIDSMNMLQMVTFVEKHYRINVDDEDITPDNFDSISRLAAYIRMKTASMPVASK